MFELDCLEQCMCSIRHNKAVFTFITEGESFVCAQ